jgi:hypothetical protein
MLVMKKPFPQNGKGFKRSPDGDASGALVWRHLIERKATFCEQKVAEKLF